MMKQPKSESKSTAIPLGGEECCRLLVESGRDNAIVMLDSLGNVAGWNQGAERFKGCGADEIIGDRFSTFYPPEATQCGLHSLVLWQQAACICLLALAEPELNAQQANTPGSAPARDGGAAAHKKLSLDDLMNLDVTSVAKTPQPYDKAPAANQVITAEDIERSGASSIPEALQRG